MNNLIEHHKISKDTITIITATHIRNIKETLIDAFKDIPLR